MMDANKEIDCVNEFHEAFVDALNNELSKLDLVDSTQLISELRDLCYLHLQNVKSESSDPAVFQMERSKLMDKSSDPTKLLSQSYFALSYLERDGKTVSWDPMVWKAGSIIKNTCDMNLVFKKQKNYSDYLELNRLVLSQFAGDSSMGLGSFQKSTGKIGGRPNKIRPNSLHALLSGDTTVHDQIIHFLITDLPHNPRICEQMEKGFRVIRIDEFRSCIRYLFRNGYFGAFSPEDIRQALKQSFTNNVPTSPTIRNDAKRDKGSELWADLEQKFPSRH